MHTDMSSWQFPWQCQSRTREQTLQQGSDCHFKLISPNECETAVNGFHSPGYMAVCMRKVLARPWVGVFVPLAY